MHRYTCPYPYRSPERAYRVFYVQTPTPSPTSPGAGQTNRGEQIRCVSLDEDVGGDFGENAVHCAQTQVMTE